MVQKTDDSAVSLAVDIRLGKNNWDRIFEQARDGTYRWGDVLGAVALVDQPTPDPIKVVHACHDYIRAGDASRIPELRELLHRYGDKSLAEDYLNCGRFELEKIGREWAEIHGYNVGTGMSGSHRVEWGSNR